MLYVGYWTPMVVTWECIPTGGPLSTHVLTFRSVPSLYFSIAYQTLLLRSTRSLLCLMNVSLKHKYICFHWSILLYTFAVFQVECVWRLLSTACTVKPCKPLVSLRFHCQWKHQNCTASILIHCPFMYENCTVCWL